MLAPVLSSSSGIIRSIPNVSGLGMADTFALKILVGSGWDETNNNYCAKIRALRDLVLAI